MGIESYVISIELPPAVTGAKILLSNSGYLYFLVTGSPNDGISGDLGLEARPAPLRA